MPANALQKDSVNSRATVLANSTDAPNARLEAQVGRHHVLLKWVASDENRCTKTLLERPNPLGLDTPNGS
ncbi:hypothetical protein [Lentibacter sp.]|uniref:hypothetical protein n=1 Tax=Lentibacter sp. TaxID=2024994 RepID=UPI003F6A4D1B